MKFQFLKWVNSKARLLSYANSERGNVAVVTAIASVGLFGAVGAAIDMVSVNKNQSSLQIIADNAALGAAKEIIVTTSKTTIQSVAENLIKTGRVELYKDKDDSFTSEIEVDLKKKTVLIKLKLQQKKIFGSFLGEDRVGMSANATAAVTAGDKLCVLSLDQASSDAIMLTDSAKITASSCDVQANSNSTSAITAWNSSWIKSAATCSVGGYQGGSTNFIPSVITDCPILPDPLASRAPPTSATKICDYTDSQVSGGTTTLMPGVYCGGLNISSGANVTFSPGIYVMRDGIFQASNGSNLYGKGVGFYLLGTNATFKFNTQSKVELYAPATGEMAGLLFFSDRDSFGRTQQINSEFAHQLVGTIYLPNDMFQIAANTAVADQSAYTAIIARRIMLNQGPNLVMNANYGSTDVPVPDGIAKTAGAVLVK